MIVLLEGIKGAGKTTIAKALMEKLDAAGRIYSYIKNRNVGSTDQNISEGLRVLKSLEGANPERVIILDRFYAVTERAYGVKNLSDTQRAELIVMHNALVAQNTVLNVYLMVDTESAQNRMGAEAQSDSLLLEVRANLPAINHEYGKLFKHHLAGDILRIDTDRYDVQQATHKIWEMITK